MYNDNCINVIKSPQERIKSSLRKFAKDINDKKDQIEIIDS